MASLTDSNAQRRLTVNGYKYAVSAKDSARFDFGSVNNVPSGSGAPYTAAGRQKVTGAPRTAIVTSTSNGISITTNSATDAYWLLYSGASSYNENSTPGLSFFTPPIAAQSFIHSISAFNSAAPQITISGLNPAGTYTIRASARTTFGDNTNKVVDYRVQGNGSVQLVSGVLISTGGGGTSGVSTGAVFTTITPASDGTIKLWFTRGTGSDIAAISGLDIFRN